MSRIGKKPIAIPAGVTVDINGSDITVKGPKGTLNRKIDSVIEAKIEDGQLLVECTKDHRDAHAKHGLYRSLLFNMVEGVSNGYKRRVVIYGVGYKANVTDKKITMDLGFSHDVIVEAPEGVTFEKISDATPDKVSAEFAVCGIDKELVGQVAANIKAKRPIEPYQGYGVRYKEDKVVLKPGKKSGK